MGKNSMIEMKQNDNSSVFYVKPENLVDNQGVIYFNDKHITIPNGIVFALENQDTLFSKIFNSLQTVVYIKDEVFAKAIRHITVEDDWVVLLDTHTKPTTKVRIDFKILLKNASFVKITKENIGKDINGIIEIDNIQFTTDILEFQGSGMFTKKESFFVDKQTFEKIENFIKSFTA
jgi:hypothetical protein